MQCWEDGWDGIGGCYHTATLETEPLGTLNISKLPLAAVNQQSLL